MLILFLYWTCFYGAIRDVGFRVGDLKKQLEVCWEESYEIKYIIWEALVLLTKTKEGSTKLGVDFNVVWEETLC